MRLVQWDPFEDLRRAGSFETTRSAWAPVVDIFEKDDDLVVRAEVPGIPRDAIDVKVENNTLIITGERHRDPEEKETQAYRRERSFGSFVRSFTLPKTVDASRITATYTDGVLGITIPKAEEAKPRSIEIKVA